MGYLIKFMLKALLFALPWSAVANDILVSENSLDLTIPRYVSSLIRLISAQDKLASRDVALV